MSAWSRYARLAVLITAAIFAAVWAVQPVHAVAESASALYDRGPAEPPTVIGAGGIGESLGRRDSYSLVDLERALTHPAEYYARRIRFRTQATNRIVCLHWGCALGSGRGSIWYGGPDPDSILHVPGNSRWSTTPPEAAASVGGPRPVSLQVEAWGLVDSYRTLWEFTDCGSMPSAELVDETALSPIFPSPATAGEWETRLSSGTDTGRDDRLNLLCYRLQWTHEPAIARQAIAGLERELASRTSTDYDYQALWFRLGRLHQEYTHNFEKASRCFRMVYAEHAARVGFNGAAVVRDGECMEALGRTELARTLYRRLIEQQPRNFWVTDALVHLGKLAGAPNSMPVDLTREETAVFQEAIRRCRLGDPVGELRALDRLRAAERRDPWILLHRVIAEQTGGRVGAAQADLARLREIDSTTHSIAKRLLAYLAPIELGEIKSRGVEFLSYPPSDSENRMEIPADTEDRNRQATVVVCRDHLARYPSDPLAYLGRVAVWADTPRISRLGVDGPRSLDRAVSLAPGSLAVRLFAYRLANDRWGLTIDGHHYGSEEIIAAARGLLHTHPAEAGPLHLLLAAYYKSHGVRALAAFHSRAYRRWLPYPR